MYIRLVDTIFEGITHRIGTKLYNDAWIKGRYPYDLYKEAEVPKQIYIQTGGYMVPICVDNPQPKE